MWVPRAPVELLEGGGVLRGKALCPTLIGSHWEGQGAGDTGMKTPSWVRAKKRCALGINSKALLCGSKPREFTVS